MSRYEYTDDMGEISGFGGGYEDMCRRMVIAGLEFWDQQGEDFDPHFQGLRNVYGLIKEDDEDAKALTEAILEPSDGGATGAMHHAAVNHIFAVRRMGWDAYCEKMREPDEEVGA